MEVRRVPRSRGGCAARVGEVDALEGRFVGYLEKPLEVDAVLATVVLALGD